MTLEQEYDRLERMARLLYEGAVRSSRESRKQTAHLRRYVDAGREYQAAKEAIAATPDDPGANEALHRASEALRKAREQLKR